MFRLFFHLLCVINRIRQSIIIRRYAKIIVEKPKLSVQPNIFVYKGKNKSTSNNIVNTVVLDDGSIIACRVGGVVKILSSGEELALLAIEGTSDWRLCWCDSKGNIYVSPHSSVSGKMNVEDRGLYRMEKGTNFFVRVCSLYNPNSTVVTETQFNDDTFWTMTEDADGFLYAGVYAHTIRPNPKIYKSVDSGKTWSVLVDFNKEGYTSSGMHIHCVSYNKWNNGLYVIVGEHNTIFKSDNGGKSWRDLKIHLEDKGSVIFPLASGFLVGSDSAYNCFIEKIDNNDKNHKRVYTGWANTVFAIRQSDVTGFLYAFCKIDSSSVSSLYYPQTDENGCYFYDNKRFTNRKRWKYYYKSVINSYPEDAIIPKHSAILISKDEGNSWIPLLINKETGNTPAGYWTASDFCNGECLAGYVNSERRFDSPHIISDRLARAHNSSIIKDSVYSRFAVL